VAHSPQIGALQVGHLKKVFFPTFKHFYVEELYIGDLVFRNAG
jgi:hypothetical protein